MYVIFYEILTKYALKFPPHLFMVWWRSHSSTWKHWGIRLSCTFGGLCHACYWRVSPVCFAGGSDNKESACNAGDLVQSLSWEYPLQKGTATYSSILTWRIPWTEESGRLQSMGLQRVRHNFHFYQFHWWNIHFHQSAWLVGGSCVHSLMVSV